ncbi:MAG: non-canonical purine NTP pyrophosphatase [Candidatus Microsaccharimonas sp.]
MSEATELVFGTGNKAKIQQVQDALGEDFIVRGINEFGTNIEVEEDGTTAQENAKKKSVAYTRALGRTVFSMDNALYFKGVADDEQPGLYVRRIGGIERSSDEEMVESYAEFVRRYGEQLEGWWEYGLSIAKADGTSIEDSIISPRLFVAKPSDKVVPGYPLESIQIDPVTGKYVSEMSSEEQVVFWQRTIGEPLSRFVRANI